MRIDDRLIKVNKYTRSGDKADERTGIVVHWVGVAGQTAEQVRYFFEKVCPREKHYSSAHYVIDLDGSILQLIPDDEVAYHVASNTVPDKIVRSHGFPNHRMLGIECCVLDNEGTMTDQTYESLIYLATIKSDKYNLFPFAGLFRHYDLTTTGKDCHRYFVRNLSEWKQFKSLVSMGVRFLRWHY
jgi:N-acetylmuramoyl-L-alanine amidase CwlA